MENQNYKRQYRQLDDATKMKISQALKGRSKSYTAKQNISKGMVQYWKSCPDKPTDGDNQSTISTKEK